MSKNLNPKFIKEFEYVNINQFIADFLVEYINCYMSNDDFRVPYKDDEGFTVYTSFDSMSSEHILKVVNSHVDRMIAQVKDFYTIDVIKKVLEYSKEHRLLQNEFWLCRSIIGYMNDDRYHSKLDPFFRITLFKFKNSEVII